LLQPKLNLKVSQRQALTPGLVQMVSVLALNKLELREMINTEMVENPVLEEVEEALSTLDERAGKEGDRERSAEETVAESERVEKDPFDEIDFGSYFQDYLDPGFRTTSNFEEYDKPSFENFLSQPSTLTDHLMWQLGALTLSAKVRLAAELIIGNLNEDGYLTATDEELLEVLLQGGRTGRSEPIPFERAAAEHAVSERAAKERLHRSYEAEGHAGAHSLIEFAGVAEEERTGLRALIETARGVVNQLDPVGIGARDLRECLLLQIAAQERDAAMMLKRQQRYQAAAVLEEEAAELEALAAEMQEEILPHGHAGERNGHGEAASVYATATHIVANCLAMLQKKDMRELTRSCGRSAEAVQAAVDLIRTLDPRPGQRYNQGETRLIEPDVAFVKRDDIYVVVMNEEDMPTLRLNQGYRKMLRQKQTEKDVREYVKERYKSAIQLLRNIEQRKNTIVRTCEVIVRRQAEFLERGEEALRPMMIKDVAEEIGVHPSTVSRAVANKYVHTAQGVYELRFFFTEGVNGPEGGDMPLVLLKRKVKKLIEEEDARKPLTDDQLAAELQRQGIQVTRRTVAKYREDMQIPSTHQRRVR
jgi:RNA polymerase sigma-54 factor